MHDPEAPLLLACRAVGRAMDLFDEAACRRLGVGRNDLRALNALEHGALSSAELAERVGLTRASVTTLVDRLEAAGYVTRTPSAHDRRSVRIALTDATWTAFRRVYRPLGQHVHAATADLSEAERGVVAHALGAIADAFDHSRTTTQEH